MGNRRKVSLQSSTITRDIWPEEPYPNSSRYTNTKAYRQERNDEHEIRYPEERTSEETVGDYGETVVNKHNYSTYPHEPAYVKVVPKNNTPVPHGKYQRFSDYSELSMPEAVTAMQKLQRLKELQMKRDITERYYSQEIKRLIGEYYFGAKYPSPMLRPTGRLQSTSFQPSSGDRQKDVAKSLEPCGTMTTITRLDCGCIQETTRPIFTTARGRVQRRNCNESQDEKLIKLTSSSLQEHLFSSLEQRKDNYRTKLRKRLPMEPRICSKIPPGGDQAFEMENEKRNDEHEVEISGHVSRTTSPCRKFSDTSVNTG